MDKPDSQSGQSFIDPSGKVHGLFTQREVEYRALARLVESGSMNESQLERLLELALGCRDADRAALCVERLLSLARCPAERARRFVRMGVICEHVDDFSSAERMYRKALELPFREELLEYWANNNLGFCLNILGRHAEAEPYLQKAVALKPERYNAFKNLGLCRQGMGRLANAVALFIRATKLNAFDGRALWHMEELVSKHPELHGTVPDLAKRLDQCRAAVAEARVWSQHREEENRP